MVISNTSDMVQKHETREHKYWETLISLPVWEGLVYGICDISKVAYLWECVHEKKEWKTKKENLERSMKYDHGLLLNI